MIGCRFGGAIGGLIATELAWPTKFLFGFLLSTVGTGLQRLTGYAYDPIKTGLHDYH